MFLIFRRKKRKQHTGCAVDGSCSGNDIDMYLIGQHFKMNGQYFSSVKNEFQKFSN